MTRHRLTAILAADMVGYSRLMAANEADTLSRLKALRRDLIDPELANHHGEIVKLTGDGMLVMFDSVVGAVEASAAVQKTMASAEAGLSADRRIAFRIGINLGDVILDDGDVYGDGVNIAARLEAEADPGGVILSDAAFQQVKGKTELSFIHLGELRLKNLPDPVRAHKIDLDPARLTPAEFEKLTGETLDLPDRPSIAVLPFQNMSGDPEQEFFADGMAEDVLTTLSRISDMVVMARNSSFVYKGRAVDIRQIGRDLGVGHVLEGSVRKAGNRVRITAQLIDARTGDHVWAERFDRNLDDIFEIQDEITREIVVALGVKLGAGEEHRVWSRHASSFEEWELLSRSLGEHYKFNREGNEEARRLSRQLLAINPASIMGRILLAWQLVVGARYGFLSDPSAAVAEAQSLIDEALAEDPNQADCIAARGAVLATLGRFDEAIATGERSCELAPNVATNHAALALTHCYAGNPAAALARIRKAIRLSPYMPDWFLFCLSEGYRGGGDLERARAVIEHWIARAPDSLLPWMRLARLAAEQGDEARAAEAAGAVLSIYPTFSARAIADNMPSKNEADREAFFDGLVAAGLPT